MERSGFLKLTKSNQMNESEYWQQKLSREQHQLDLQNQSIMNRLIEQEEINLFSILKPSISIDGNQYCVLYGKDLHDGVCGFGSTMIEAIHNFNLEFYKPLTKIK